MATCRNLLLRNGSLRQFANAVILGINSFNNYNLFAIAWLYSSRPAGPISSSNNFSSYNNTYLAGSFIKILDILI